MKRLAAISAGLLLVLSALAYSDSIRQGSLNAKSNQNGVDINWYSADETSVQRFEVYRSVGSGNGWSLIATLLPKGSGSYYDYTDGTAFKLTDNFYQYFVRTVYGDGSRVDSPTIGVIHNTSSVRRTWGSIKAMFR